MNKLFSVLLFAMTLGGCGAASSISARHETATKIASSAGMSERILQAGIFNLTGWERVQQPNAPVDLYIEGDGLAWLDKHTKSMNPTPPDPLALRLAAADKRDNVFYLARPCQYTGLRGEGSCSDIYWTTGMAAAEVVSAYQQALDDIKARYHVTGFNLVGYSGGAAIAVLVAAGRTDILSIRTVAGNTDYAAFTALHEVSSISGSIDPASVAAKVAQIPQMHFIGGEDTVVPQAVFDGWKQASGTSTCVHSNIITAADHEKGWAEVWPDLLNIPVSCTSAP